MGDSPDIDFTGDFLFTQDLIKQQRVILNNADAEVKKITDTGRLPTRSEMTNIQQNALTEFKNIAAQEANGTVFGLRSGKPTFGLQREGKNGVTQKIAGIYANTDGDVDAAASFSTKHDDITFKASTNYSLTGDDKNASLSATKPLNLSLVGGGYSITDTTINGKIKYDGEETCFSTTTAGNVIPSAGHREALSSIFKNPEITTNAKLKSCSDSDPTASAGLNLSFNLIQFSPGASDTIIGGLQGKIGVECETTGSVTDCNGKVGIKLNLDPILGR